MLPDKKKKMFTLDILGYLIFLNPSNKCAPPPPPAPQSTFLDCTGQHKRSNLLRRFWVRERRLKLKLGSSKKRVKTKYY